MAAKDRIQAIKQMVTSGKKVTVSSLSGTFQVIEETIRRDLEKLGDEDSLIRAYDDAVLSTVTLTESIHLYKHASSFYEEKQLTAHKTPPFIDNRTTTAIDSSSTMMELLKLLQDHSGLTLLISSAETIHILAQPEIKIVSTGGELNRNTLSLQRGVTREIIKCYHVNIMVMSCKGLDINSGALDSDEAEVEIKKTMIRQAAEVTLLIDHSKSNRKTFVQLADFGHINYIITDRSPDIEWIAFCKDSNIQLVW